MRPAVVVLAYERPTVLERLLQCVARARYPDTGDVPLVISIDAGGDPEVLQRAAAFEWEHGAKEVIVAERHLGLVGHFHRAGELAAEFGSIILLEDDLVVSPAYYAFASEALGEYAEDHRIAGVSLYSLWFNGYNHLPFVPWLDDADVFFLQIPFYLGQAFTAAQWARYVEWRAMVDPRPDPTDPIHPLYLRFGPEEWFPERVKYLVATGRYYVYPRHSVSTSFGHVGTHFARPTRRFQTPMQHERRQGRFVPFETSVAVYDSFFEMLPERLSRLASRPDVAQCDVDLYATKPTQALRRELVLTCRPSRRPLAAFGRAMWPMEANVVHDVAGEDIVLSRLDDLRAGWWPDLRVEAALHTYFCRGRRLSWMRTLAHRLAGGRR